MAKATTTIKQVLTYQVEHGAWFAANQALKTMPISGVRLETEMSSSLTSFRAGSSRSDFLNYSSPTTAPI